MKQEKNSILETKNSYIEDIGGNIIDFNKNNEKDIVSIIGERDFKDSDLEEFVENFSNYADDNNIDFEKFEYGEYTEDFYRQKFPGFEPWVHKILADCSKKKLEDHRKKNTLTFEERDTTLTFD
tara:strand:+ start:16582 stop:16953 length:372 start_codon:yes stop_codon:yes gene_type:complete